MLAFGKLLEAMNPNATPDRGGVFSGWRQRQPRGGEGRPQPEGPAPGEDAVKAERARREMAARFDEFVAARAKERGIELPGRPRS